MNGNRAVSKVVAPVLLSLLGTLSIAAPAGADRDAAPAYEAVSSFSMLGGMRDFDALGRDRLIVWTSSFRPYLIELAAPSFDLKFARAIGIRARGYRVYSGFDSVIVDGMSYPIKRIYKLSRDEARALDAQTRA